MKFICTADLHIKIWQDNEIMEDGIPKRLAEIFSTLHDMVEYARNNSISTIIIAGDINDLKNKVDTEAFVLMREFLENNLDIRFIILHGNHDSSNKTKIRSAIQLLEGSNVETIIDKVSIHNNTTFLPYSNNIVDMARNCDSNDIIISHFGLGDAQLSSGISLRTGINSSDLKKFKLVILGHYHKPQKTNHCYYIGSPIQLRRDEHDEEKRFLVIDNETLEVESILTDNYRKYYDIIIDDKTMVQDALERSKILRSEGHWVRIRKNFEGPIIDTNGIQIIDDYEEEYQIREVRSNMSQEERFRKYMEIKGIPEGDQDEYIQVCAEAIDEVEEQKA